MNPRNRYTQAFTENFNIVGLAGFVALAAATLQPLLLLPAFVLEAAYLIFVPDTRWYIRRLAKLHDAEVLMQRTHLKEQALPVLRPALQQRFLRLEEMRRQIGDLAMGEETWFLEVLRKLDYLLDKFLQFAGKDGQFRTYLDSILAESRGQVPTPSTPPAAPRTPLTSRRAALLDDLFDEPPRRGRNGKNAAAPGPAPRRAAPRPRDDADDMDVQKTVAEVQAHYDKELNDLRVLLANEADEGTRAVLQKRIEVLERRREFVGKMGRILLNLEQQLGLLEDTFGLISDEIRARPPEQVLADIEDVVTQTNTMTQVLEEIAPYEQSLARLMN